MAIEKLYLINCVLVRLYLVEAVTFWHKELLSNNLRSEWMKNPVCQLDVSIAPWVQSSVHNETSLNL